jgi:hypothetical protein
MWFSLHFSCLRCVRTLTSECLNQSLGSFWSVFTEIPFLACLLLLSPFWYSSYTHFGSLYIMSLRLCSLSPSLFFSLFFRLSNFSAYLSSGSVFFFFCHLYFIAEPSQQNFPFNYCTFHLCNFHLVCMSAYVRVHTHTHFSVENPSLFTHYYYFSFKSFNIFFLLSYL